MLHVVQSLLDSLKSPEFNSSLAGRDQSNFPGVANIRHNNEDNRQWRLMDTQTPETLTLRSQSSGAIFGETISCLPCYEDICSIHTFPFAIKLNVKRENVYCT